MNLEADHNLPLAGFALDAERCVCVSHDLPPFVRARGEAGALLDREAGVEHDLLVELRADQVQAERKSLPVEATRLGELLAARGYEPVYVDISELRKAGGGPKCCTREIRKG